MITVCSIKFPLYIEGMERHEEIVNLVWLFVAAAPPCAKFSMAIKEIVW